MPASLEEDFATSYPAAGIDLPEAEHLWRRGRRQRRRRQAVAAGAAASVIAVAVGLVAVQGVLPQQPAPMVSTDASEHGDAGPAGDTTTTEDAASTEDAEPTEDAAPTGNAAPAEDSALEQDCDTLGGYARALCEDVQARGPRPDPTDAEIAEAQQRQQASQELHAEMNQGLLHPPDGWEPAEDPPTDLSGLQSQDSEGIWYVDVDTATGLPDRAMLEDRVGVEVVAELCAWLDRESSRADEAAGEAVSRHTVAQRLLGAAEVTGGDGLSLVVAASCRD